MKPFRPMKAATLPTEFTEGDIKWPILVSPKYDGIRALVREGKVVSLSSKPIPNAWVQRTFGHPEFEGLDGELIFGDPTHSRCYNKTYSAVMTHNSEVEVDYYVFDNCYSSGGFQERLHRIYAATALTPIATTTANNEEGGGELVWVPHIRIETVEDLLAYENKTVSLGYEGVMIRWVDGPYKQGRSTNKEGFLLKMKRFLDSEAIIIGAQELEHNDNEAQLSELGYTVRTSHKENKRPGDVLGALLVKDVQTGVEFKIGTGFDAQQRQKLWEEH